LSSSIRLLYGPELLAVTSQQPIIRPIRRGGALCGTGPPPPPSTVAFSINLPHQLFRILCTNSVYLISPNITDFKKKLPSGGFTICTHMTSLTFDLTSDQEKLPRNRKKPFQEASDTARSNGPHET